MILRLVISALLIALAGYCNSVMDNVATRYDRFDAKYDIENDQWWDYRISDLNKWALDNEGKIIIKDNGKRKERFFLSSSSLVMFTDAWHFFKSLMLVLIAISSIILGSVDININRQKTIKYIGIGIVWYLLFTITFQLNYLT